MSIWLVRHTRVALPIGLCYGRTEVPLAGSFARDAQALRAKLPEAIDVVWSSPAVRCQRLALTLDRPVKLDERLWERNFGDWEGKRWESFHGPESDRWSADPWNLRPSGGASGTDLEKRVAAVRQDVQTSAVGRTVVVITHGGVVRAWRRLVEGVDRDTSMS
ncbi:MAG: histidine phosphatase family protein [Candidatus Synoicihabitans palmerolidicus]|nr:histidine phosphatase family protein [Candidatus Synoicihabitans palmerolidicus]